MKKYILVAWMILTAVQYGAAETWTLEKAVRQSISASAELAALHENLKLAELEEPGLLANTDPRLVGELAKGEDWSPTPVPQITGRRSLEESAELGIAQKWLTGTEAKIALSGNRYDSDAAFRSFNPSYADRFSFELRQPLARNFWGRPDKSLRRRARSNVDAARARYGRASELLALRTAFAYIEALYVQEELRIQEGTLGDLKLLLKRQEEKRKFGIAEETDILQTRSAIQLKELDIRITRASLEIAKQNLLTLMSVEQPEPGTEFQAIPSAPRKEYNLNAVIQRAVDNRQDILALKAQVSALEADLKATRLNGLPSIDLTGRYALSSLDSGFSSSAEDLVARGKPVFRIGLKLEIPLLRKSEKVSVQSALHRLAQARHTLAESVLQTKKDIRNSWELYHLNTQKADALKEVVQIQKAKYAEEEKSFQRGRSSTDMLIRFQTDVQQSESRRVRAQFDEIAADLALNAAAGTLSDRVPVNHP